MFYDFLDKNFAASVILYDHNIRSVSSFFPMRQRIRQELLMAFPQVHYFMIITSFMVISSTTFGITSLSCKTAFNWTNEQISILKGNLLYGQIYINFIHGGQLNASAEHNWRLTPTEGLSRRWMSFCSIGWWVISDDTHFGDNLCFVSAV